MSATSNSPVPSVAIHDARIPALGFGTFQLDRPAARRMVEAALAIGYRHLDTAQIYRNEDAVGEAIRAVGVPRDEIFLTTKVWVDHYRPRDLQRSAEESLRRLRQDEVDLLLLHWPKLEIPLADILGALAEVQTRGLARHVGVSNFNVDLLDQAVRESPVPLVANQVEYHPFLDQQAVLAAVRRHGMALTAYSPLAQGKVFGEATLRRIGERHGKSGGQVALRWLLQQESVTAIPRSSDEEHARANFAIFDFTLDDQEIAEISALGSREGRLIDPEGLAPAWD